MNSTVLKIYDAGNKDIAGKKRKLFHAYWFILMTHLVISLYFDYGNFVYFLIAIAISVIYIVFIIKLAKKLKLQDIIIEDESLSVLSEDVSYKFQFQNILTIQKKRNFNLSFLMMDGTEKQIKTDRFGFIKLMSNVFDNEKLRKKINFQSFF